MIIKENEVHIYRHSINTPPESLDKFRKLLSLDEIQRANRFKFEKHRIHFITGRALLRIILGKYMDSDPSDINFSYHEKGKPYLKDSTIKFNLAHSGGEAVYALTLHNELGIDLEEMKEMPDALDIAQRFFSKNEVIEFMKAGGENIVKAFFNCWTRKEAFIKAIGEGLSYPLSEFSVTLLPGDVPAFTEIKSNPDEIEQWSLLNIDAEENFISSLALKAKNVKIIYQEV